MPLTLMVERDVVPGAQGEIKKLLRELRSSATRQPGFVSGRSVADLHNPTIFMTISMWSSVAAWENWEKNLERAEIIGRINELIQGKPTVRLWLDDEDAPPAAGG